MKRYLLLGILSFPHLSLFAQAPSNSMTMVETRALPEKGTMLQVTLIGIRDPSKHLIKITDQDSDGKLMYSVNLYLTPDGQVGRADKVAPDGSIFGVLVYFEGTNAKAFDKNGNPANLADWEFDMTDIEMFAGSIGGMGVPVMRPPPKDSNPLPKSAPAPNSPADLNKLISEIIRTEEANDVAGALKITMLPEIFTNGDTPEKMARMVAQDPAASTRLQAKFKQNVEALRAIQGQTPTMTENGTHATYTLSAPDADGKKAVYFHLVRGHWYPAAVP